MKSTPLTQGVSLLILAMFVLYGLFSLPFAGLLLALAAGLIAYGSVESFEMSVAVTIIVGVLYALISRSGMLRQAQQDMQVVREGFSSDGAAKISNRVERIYKASTAGPAGVYASPFVEGFADAKDEAAAKITNGGDKAKSASEDQATAATSQPAAASGSGGAGSGIPPPQPPPVTKAVEQAMKQASGFRGDSGSDGQFKLGVLPDESKGGFHIDQGTTVLNALQALKPDQISAMTKDTQALIETQKSLMSMLGSMKPMLQDGKTMMEQFQQMVGDSKFTLGMK